MRARAPLLAILGSLAMSMLAAAADDDRAEERARMVEEQVVARGMHDARVLAALRKVPRHRFVPPGERERAYRDRPLPIGSRQTISQPYIVALMSQLADVQAGERVLEVGTGSGYQAAVLAELGAEVHSIEIVPELAEAARRALRETGYERVEVITGDGYRGLPAHAPFDAILVTAAPDHVPQPLIDQLADGGKLVIPVGETLQQLRVLERKGEGVVGSTVTSVMFVPMTGEAQEERSD
ncbi:MAG TPA: protein-L-isoaspartate(D-aspartate) O-methyltransferase [Myxococcota bacterium]|nr:protein-L-isoaspartate(D-aspartate) O-methyltransferase [Myxococcota bacterium]